MPEFVNQIIFRVQNFIEVIPRELQEYNLGMAIGGLLWFGTFYFVSKWFKAYIIRIVLFSVGVFILWDVTGRNNMLTSIDFYSSLGLLIPQIEIVEITFLILKERTLFVYDKLIELILFIVSPFVWLFNVIQKVAYFFKAKQEEKEYSREKAKYEQKEQQYNGYKQRQKREEQSQNQYQKQTKQEVPKREEKKTYSRWDSSNAYEVLGIDNTATASEIKKAYRNLSKIYHPDLTLTNKEEHQIIFQKISNAYDKLK